MTFRSLYLMGLLLLMVGCAESKVAVYSAIDPTEKTITVPIGNALLVGRIKEALQNSGWQLAIDQGPTRTRGELGPQVALETFSTYRTRYRLVVFASWFDWCLTGSAAINYNLSLIDNMTGREVLAQSGRDCESRAVDKFMNAIRSDSARR